MDPMQNPQIQQMIMALQHSGPNAGPSAAPPYADQQASLGNGPMPGMQPPMGSLMQAPPMTQPPQPLY